MNKEKLTELYHKYQLEKDHFFTKEIGNKSFTIITREGIEKIEAKEKIKVKYESIKSEPNFAVIQAFGEFNGKSMETFGSALKGANYKDGNTNTWYVTEIAEKRALSRIVLKLTGFYALGIKGEDESDSFKKPEIKKTTKEELINKIKNNG